MKARIAVLGGDGAFVPMPRLETVTGLDGGDEGRSYPVITGDYTADDWDDVLGEVEDVRRRHTVDYLIGTPLLGDYLEEALSQFGRSCEEFELGRM